MKRGLHIGVIGARGFAANYSGIERVCQNLYPALGRRGHRVTIYSRELEPPSPAPGVSVRNTSKIACHWAETVSHSFSSAWDANLRPYDVIHLHALAPALSCWAFRLHNIPTVLTVHGLDWNRARWRGTGRNVLRLAERMAVRLADEIIVVSRELQDYYKTTWRRRTNLIYNSVDFESSLEEGQQGRVRQLGLEPRRYLLYAGRLAPEKRIGDVIQAVCRASRPCCFAIAGEGDRDYTARLRLAAGRDTRIRFLGHQDRSTVRSLMRHCVAFISASELEGFSMALLECVAEGAPAIVTDIAPHRELLSSWPDYDLFFPRGDIAMLSLRIQQILEVPERFRDQAKRIRTVVAREFPIDRMIDQTESVLISAALQRSASGEEKAGS